MTWQLIPRNISYFPFSNDEDSLIVCQLVFELRCNEHSLTFENVLSVDGGDNEAEAFQNAYSAALALIENFNPVGLMEDEVTS